MFHLVVAKLSNTNHGPERVSASPGSGAFPRACNVWNGVSKCFDTHLEHLNPAQELERFGELVLAHAALHDQLRAAPNEQAFIELAVRLAAERGCELTASALQIAIHQKRRAWLERWL